MKDMQTTVAPKSDQLNADDLIGGRTITIKVTGVDITMNEQPVAIHYEGENGKPYKPGKSMRRVLIHCWGADAGKYVGRSITLYRDEKVKFGGIEVGGLRISHLSDIDSDMTMALTTTRAQRRPFTVQPLSTRNRFMIEQAISTIEQAADMPALENIFKEFYRIYSNENDRQELVRAKDKKKNELTNPQGENNDAAQ